MNPEQKTTNTSAMAPSPRHHLLPFMSKKRLFLVLVAVVLSIATIYTAVAFTKSAQRKAALQKAAKQEAAAVTQMNEANKALFLAISGDTKGAIAVAQQEIANASDPQVLLAAYNKLAAVYIETKDYSNALANAKKANAIHDNATSQYILGQSYEARGNIKLAVAAYQKAVDLSASERNDPRGNYGMYADALASAKAKL